MGCAKSENVPKYRIHKATGQGYVTLNGHRYYLGRGELPETRKAYDRLIAEWLVSGRHLPVHGTDITVVELAARFWTWAEEYYGTRETRTTSEVSMLRLALRPVLALYGDTPASAFSPLSLKAVRQCMIKQGWSRPYTNRQVVRVRRVFKWGVAEELVPASVHHGLQAVSPLKRGRTQAPETDPVLPVSPEVVARTVEHLTPTLRTMVQLLQHTGARPGEVCIMRACDIDMTGRIWVFRPFTHKTAHHGRSREIYLGPRGQRVLEPFLRLDTGAYLFSPAQSEKERQEARAAGRKTPLSCGNRPGSNRVASRKRPPGERYTAERLATAIRYACKRAFPDNQDMWWTPGRLRHSFASEVRREHGLEAAQILLGHSRADVTQVYAERDVARALEVARQIG